MNRNSTLILSCTGLLICLSSCSWWSNASISEKDLAKKAGAMLAQLGKQGEASCAVLIAKNDKIILEKAYGFSDSENLIPNTTETLFPLGSISKSFTAMLILLLAQEGKLDINDPVQKYIPKFKHPDVTIHHLITNSSGLPRDFFPTLPSITDPIWGAKFQIYSKTTFSDELKAALQVPLDFKPGTKFSYSNFGFTILTQIINQLDGSYETSLEKRILKPLKMTHTYAGPREIIKNQIALRPQKPNTISSPNLHFEMGATNGAGSLISTVHDMYLWAQCIEKDTLLKPTYAQIQKTALTQLSETLGYACALTITHTKNKTMIWHNGAFGTYSTYMGIVTYPETKDSFIVVVLSNHGFPDSADSIATKIIGIIEQHDPKIRTLSEDISPTVAKIYEGDYQSDQNAKEPIVSIKSGPHNTFWYVYSPDPSAPRASSFLQVKLLQERGDAFATSISNDQMPIVFTRDKNNTVTGFTKGGSATYHKIGTNSAVK